MPKTLSTPSYKIILPILTCQARVSIIGRTLTDLKGHRFMKNLPLIPILYGKNNNKEGYDIPSILLHWTRAIAMLLLFGSAFLRTKENGLTHFHVNVGIFSIALFTFCLIWRLAQGFPKPLPAWKPYETFLGRGAHLSLLFLPFLVACTGLGLILSPRHTPVNEFFKSLHEPLAFLVLFVVIAHILASLKHAILNKDGTLRRIIYPNKKKSS